MSEIQTTGVVTDHKSRRHHGGGRPSVLIYPVVKFQTQDGETIEFESGLGSNMPPKVGEEVTVLYDPSRPDVGARLTVGSTFRFNPKALLIVGGIFLGIVVFFFLFFVAVILFVSL